MVSCHALWVAISYRFAACFTRVGSTLRVELKFTGDRSSILGTIIYSSRKLRAENDKMRQKLLKNCTKAALVFIRFCNALVFILLKF